MGIHALGLLHRDVKPHNVRVTPEGRVVLLDFGLVTHLAQTRQTSEGTSAGTVAYMAPEQAHDDRLGPSADWYALGVLLYELMTGQLPFAGSAIHIMLSKQRELPPPPSSRTKGVPADLDALCMGLLATKVEERLDGEALLAELARASGLSLSPPTFETRSEEPFVGRGDELALLDERYTEATRHGVRLALVEGESGIGKSALVERFARELPLRDPRVLVLRGRCHAAEQLGYKAFDGAVDELSRYLRALPESECHALLPADAHLLPVLFPVLSRASAIARAQLKVGRVERYPLFAAFVELLLRLGHDRTVVIAVDDLQWADEASLVLLKTLLDSTRSPRLLIVATVRPLEGLDDSVGEGLRALVAHAGVSRLRVGPLGEVETCALAARLTGDAPDERSTRLLAAESGGHPLFVTELVRHVESLGRAGAGAIDLDAAILQRVEALPLSARLALELLCVASGPVPQSVLRNALGTSVDAAQPLIAMLRAQRLVRTARRGEIVSYHDRMREAVLAAIDAPTLAAHHRKLARAWETQTTASPARVAQHWLGCAQHERALPWLEQAAQKAEQGGAFERAAEHYRSLLGLDASVVSAELRHGFKLKLSEALAGAGRCAESASELLEALSSASAQDAPELAIRAAQYLLQAGRVVDGLAAARRAFELLGLSWPKGRVRVALRFFYNRALIGMAGVDVTSDRSQHVHERDRIELDALKRLVLPMAWADYLRDAEVVSRHTSLALRSGAAGDLAYALSSEACMRAIQQASPATVEELFSKASIWLKRDSTPELQGHLAMMQGTAATFRGDFIEAEAQLEAAHDIYRTKCPASAWELSNARGVLLNVWYQRGRFVRHAEMAQRWLDEAAARGDAFARATYLVAGFGCNRHLLRDQPAHALAEIAHAMVPWRSESVAFQHFTEAFAIAWVITYVGGTNAEAYWAEVWPRLSKSFLFRTPFMREGLLSTRVLTALAQASTGTDTELSRQAARNGTRLLARSRSAAGQAFGSLVCAQVAFLDGDRATATSLAARAVAESKQMGTIYGRSAEVLLARAEGAADARDRELRLRDWLASEGWVEPERALHLLLPVARTWR